MRDVVTLRVAWQTLDPEAQFRIKEKVVTEFYITSLFLGEVYKHLHDKFSTRDSDEWCGEHCQDCGGLYGVGVVHTCPSDTVGFAGSQYI